MQQRTSSSTICIPITFGRNRLRGTSVGPMVEDDDGAYDKLRQVLSTEGDKAGVNVTNAWLTKAVGDLLNLYAQYHADWDNSRDKDGTLGLIWQAVMPSGTTLLFGDRRLLDRMKVSKEGAHA